MAVPSSERFRISDYGVGSRYIEVIWQTLRPGGVWINLGPLLWHWADAHSYLNTPELSIEVPLESVLRCASAVGFVCAR